MSVIDYLSSKKNIAGSALGLGGLGLTLSTGLAGPWWPVVVGGLYGIGALLAPDDDSREQLVLGDVGAEELERTRRGLAHIEQQLPQWRRVLPGVSVGQIERMIVRIKEILARVDRLSTDPSRLIVLASVTNDYVPTAVKQYHELPRDYAETHVMRNGRTPAQELDAQMTLLAKEVDEMAEAIFTGDANALSAHGSFLEDKFRDSELDLG